MAEGGGLLNRYTVNSRIVGSNPIPSATSLISKAKLSGVGPFAPRERFDNSERFATGLPPDHSAKMPAMALSTISAARSSVFPKRWL